MATVNCASRGQRFGDANQSVVHRPDCALRCRQRRPSGNSRHPRQQTADRLPLLVVYRRLRTRRAQSHPLAQLVAGRAAPRIRSQRLKEDSVRIDAPVALYVDSVPLGVGYGCRLGIRLVAAELAWWWPCRSLHPGNRSAAPATSRNPVAASEHARCFAIVNRPPRFLWGWGNPEESLFYAKKTT